MQENFGSRAFGVINDKVKINDNSKKEEKRKD